MNLSVDPFCFSSCLFGGHSSFQNGIILELFLLIKSWNVLSPDFVAKFGLLSYSLTSLNTYKDVVSVTLPIFCDYVFLMFHISK